MSELDENEEYYMKKYLKYKQKYEYLKQQDQDGGSFIDKLKYDKLIFLNADDIKDYSIFQGNAPKQVDISSLKNPTVSGVDKMNKLKEIKYNNGTIEFQKEELYKYLHKKGYSAFTNEDKVYLIELTMEQLKKLGKDIKKAVSMPFIELGNVFTDIKNSAIDTKDKILISNIELNFKGLSDSAKNEIANKLKEKVGLYYDIKNAVYVEGSPDLQPQTAEYYDPTQDVQTGGESIKFPYKLNYRENIQKAINDINYKNKMDGKLIRMNTVIVINETLAGKDSVKCIYTLNPDNTVTGCENIKLRT